MRWTSWIRFRTEYFWIIHLPFVYPTDEANINLTSFSHAGIAVLARRSAIILLNFVTTVIVDKLTTCAAHSGTMSRTRPVLTNLIQIINRRVSSEVHISRVAQFCTPASMSENLAGEGGILNKYRSQLLHAITKTVRYCVKSRLSQGRAEASVPNKLHFRQFVMLWLMFQCEQLMQSNELRSVWVGWIL